MHDRNQAQEIKCTCARFYQHELIRKFIGDVLHPGGLKLTEHLGEVIGLGAGDKLLDIACGPGRSVVHLAKRFDCRVTGIDFGVDNIAAGEKNAAAQGVSDLTEFKSGDAEALPFPDNTFDAVISECSFCTFPDKNRAAQEMARVLRPQGRLGITDMTVNGPLPEDLKSQLGWVICITGANSAQDYVRQLKNAGFGDFYVEPQNESLVNMINDGRKKLLGAEILVKLGKLDLGNFDVSQAKEVARRALELAENGVIGYTLITATKNL